MTKKKEFICNVCPQSCTVLVGDDDGEPVATPVRCPYHGPSVADWREVKEEPEIEREGSKKWVCDGCVGSSCCFEDPRGGYRVRPTRCPAPHGLSNWREVAEPAKKYESSDPAPVWPSQYDPSEMDPEKPSFSGCVQLRKHQWIEVAPDGKTLILTGDCPGCKEKDGKIGRLETIVSTLGHSVSEKNAEIAGLNRVNFDLAANGCHTRDTAEQMNAEVLRLEGVIERLKREINHLKSYGIENEKLRERVEDCDKTNSELRGQLAGLEPTIEQLKQELRWSK